MNIEEKVKFINDNIGGFIETVKIDSEIKLFNKSIIAENFLTKLLNVVYDLKLININSILPNAVAIDLGDKENRIAIQVTNTADTPKIRKTHTKFIEKKLFNNFDRLVFVGLKGKSNIQKNTTFYTEGKFDFDKGRDVLDLKDICKDLYNLNSIEKLDQAYEIIEQYLVGIKRESNSLKKYSELFTNPIKNFLGNDPTLNVSREYELETLDFNLLILSGKPGCGKSVLSKQLVRSSAFKNKEVLWIKGVDDNKILEMLLFVEESEFYDLVVFDSFERITGSNYAKEILFKIRELLKNNIVKVVITIREYNTAFVNGFFLGVDKKEIIHVTDFTKEQVISILEKYGINISNDNIVEVLRNPFYLDMVMSLDIADEVSGSISEYDIVNKIWDNLLSDVSDLELATVQKSLLELALKSVTQNSTIFTIDSLSYPIELLVASDILASQNTMYSFKYDRIVDIIMIKYFDIELIRHSDDLINLVLEVQDDFVLLRSFELWLHYILTKKTKEVFKYFIDIFTNMKIEMFWKNMLYVTLLLSDSIWGFLKSEKTHILKNDEFLQYLFDIAHSIPNNYFLKNPSSVVSGDNSFLIINSTPSLYLLEFTNKYVSDLNPKIHRMIYNTLVKVSNGNFLQENYANTTCKIMMRSFKRVVEQSKGQYVIRDRKSADNLVDVFLSYYSGDMKYSKSVVDALRNRTETTEFSDRLYTRIVEKEYKLMSAKFIEDFYEVISELIFEYTIEYEQEKSIYSYGSNLDIEYSFGVNYNQFPFSPSSTGNNNIFNLLSVNYGVTIKKLINIFNSAAERYHELSPTYSSRKYTFKYKGIEKDIYDRYNCNYLLAYRGQGVIPNLLISYLMGIEYYLLLNKENDKTAMLEEIIQSTNNVMLIGLVLSICLDNPERYADIILEIASNNEILYQDLQRETNETMSLRFHNNRYEYIDEKQKNMHSNRKDNIFKSLYKLQQGKNNILIKKIKSFLISKDISIETEACKEDEVLRIIKRNCKEYNIDNLRVTGKVEGGYIVEPVVDDQKLNEMIQEDIKSVNNSYSLVLNGNNLRSQLDGAKKHFSTQQIIELLHMPMQENDIYNVLQRTNSTNVAILYLRDVDSKLEEDKELAIKLVLGPIKRYSETGMFPVTKMDYFLEVLEYFDKNIVNDFLLCLSTEFQYESILAKAIRDNDIIGECLNNLFEESRNQFLNNVYDINNTKIEIRFYWLKNLFKRMTKDYNLNTRNYKHFRRMLTLSNLLLRSDEIIENVSKKLFSEESKKGSSVRYDLMKDSYKYVVSRKDTFINIINMIISNADRNSIKVLKDIIEESIFAFTDQGINFNPIQLLIDNELVPFKSFLDRNVYINTDSVMRLVIGRFRHWNKNLLEHPMLRRQTVINILDNYTVTPDLLNGITYCIYKFTDSFCNKDILLLLPYIKSSFVIDDTQYFIETIIGRILIDYDDLSKQEIEDLLIMTQKLVVYCNSMKGLVYKIWLQSRLNTI